MRAFTTLRLPDGNSAVVTMAEAHELQERLLALGLAPGAAAAAGKLRDGTSSWGADEPGPPDVLFNSREAVAVVAAATGWIEWGIRTK